jgi:hypothetical protein
MLEEQAQQHCTPIASWLAQVVMTTLLPGFSGTSVGFKPTRVAGHVRGSGSHLTRCLSLFVAYITTSRPQLFVGGRPVGRAGAAIVHDMLALAAVSNLRYA